MENPYFISPIDEYVRLAEHLGKQQKRTIHNKKICLEKYRQHKGNIKRTCEDSGISRKTFYNWYDTDAYFRRVLELVAVHYEPSDTGVTMMDLILQENRMAVWCFLRKHHPNYKKKRVRERNGPDLYDRDNKGRFSKGV